MAKHDEGRLKLLIGVVGRDDDEAYAEACNECTAALHFSGFGAGTAKSSYRSFFGIDEVEKRVVLSLIPASAERNVLHHISEKLCLYLPGRGVAFTVPLSGISNIIHRALTPTDKSERPSEKQKKKENAPMHELVIAVVNQKYSDAAIDAARNAGATGCTLLHTKSIGNAVAEARIGTTLKTETDTLTFLTTTEYKPKIMEAVKAVAGLQTEGSAVLFSLPVDTLVGIGRFAKDEDGEEKN